MNSTDVPAFYMNVLEFCDWTDRAALNSICKVYASFARTESYFQWCCRRMTIEHGIYSPATLPDATTWRSLFVDLFPLRNMWIQDSVDPQELVVTAKDKAKFKVNVFARFKPKDLVAPTRTEAKKIELPPASASASAETVEGATEAATEEARHDSNVEVSLPLHQRLGLIKMSHRITSNREALKLLAADGGWFKDKWTSINRRHMIGESELGDENLDIQNKPKFRSGGAVEKIVASVQSIDSGTGKVVMIAPDVGLREFTFDGLFSGRSSQQSIYNSTTKRLVMDFINGYNATAIVYGQTGSGKSYSMFGKDDESIYGVTVSRERGIVPRACEEVLAAIVQKRQFGIDAQVSVSYVEVFGDQVSDLLRGGARCGQSKVASQRYVLSGAAEVQVESVEDVVDILRTGESQKRYAATAMNERSTRAHVLFILTLRQSCNKSNTTHAVSRTSRLFLADLGGSEQVKKSKVDAGGHRRGILEEFSAGFEMAENMREAVYINLGLLALKKVIDALNHRSYYVPYQDSKLTMLLSDGLGGNSKTSMIVCASSETFHATETIASLRFGERCALVETEAINKASMLASVLADIDKRITSLQHEIVRKERWELREERRVDELAEEGTVEAAINIEVKKVYLPVGAEVERNELAELLKKRAKFTGQETFDEDSEETANQRRVVGFGQQYAEIYGIGQGYSSVIDIEAENERFEERVQFEAIPEVVRRRFKGKQWTSNAASAIDPSKLEEKAKKANRNKLVYSGISL